MWKKRCFTILLVSVATIMFSSCSKIRLLQTDDDDVANKTPEVSDTDDSTVCSTSVSSPSSDLLQKTVDEVNSSCLAPLQIAEEKLSAVADITQRMRELAVQGSNGIMSPEDFQSLNSEFVSLVTEINSNISAALYNENIPLLSGDPVELKYTLLGSSVTCINTAQLSTAEITADLASISISDQSSAQSSVPVIEEVITKLGRLRSIAGFIRNRAEQDQNLASNLQVIINLPAAPSICEFVYLAARVGIESIERILDTARQNFAYFGQLNTDTTVDGYEDYMAMVIAELKTSINHALVLSNIDGVPLFQGDNKYTNSCFDGKAYDFRPSALDLSNLSASTQVQIIATVQKLDTAIATLEATKIELGISDADADIAAVMDKYALLEAYQIEHPEDTCTAFNMNIELMVLSIANGKVIKRDKELSTLNKMTDPLYNNLNTSVQSVYDCISVQQTAEGALAGIMDMIQRQRELAIQSANGIYTDGDRFYIQTEFADLINNIIMTKDDTKFNDKVLLNGGNDLFKYFSNKEPATCFNPQEFDIGDITAVLQTLSVATKAGAEASLPIIDQALQELTAIRAQAGAYQNRLESEASLYPSLSEIAMVSVASGPAYFDLSVIDMAKVGVSAIQSALQRMVDLAAQAAMVENPERILMQKEIVELLKFIDIANITVQVNKNALISGASVFKDTYFAGNSFDLRTSALGIHTIDISTAVGATEASTLLDAASSEVASSMVVLENLTL